jgi:signal transduction histidine kinase
MTSAIPSTFSPSANVTYPVTGTPAALVTVLADWKVQKTTRENKAISDLTEHLLREKRIAGLSHMAGGLAHEISNPLTIIYGKASMLQERANVNASMESYKVVAACESIVKTSDRAIKILRGLKSFAREAAHDPMELVALSQITDQCLEIQQSRLERHAIDCKIEIQDGLPEILCREVQIVQIFMNLLTNSVDAIVQPEAQERWIEVVATYSESEIQIDVTDSGPGVEDHFRDHLMDPFFTTKANGLGMGVGLSLSRAIAQYHEGSLSLLEDTKNTCFRLILPVSPHPDLNVTSQLEGAALY